MMIHFRYSAKIVDLETAFLYGELEEEIYMKCPQGMSDVGRDDCIILNKRIYGRVQAVMQCIKKPSKIKKIRILSEAMSTHASTARKVQRI